MQFSWFSRELHNLNRKNHVMCCENIEAKRFQQLLENMKEKKDGDKTE